MRSSRPVHPLGEEHLPDADLDGTAPDGGAPDGRASDGGVQHGGDPDGGRPVTPASGLDICRTVTAGIHALDARTGEVRAGGATPVGQLLAHTLPAGWVPAVTCPDPSVTIADAVAHDLTGGDHRGSGSFGDHVLGLDLLRSDGRSVRLSREQDAEAFWASVGGLGLTGVITGVTLRLRAVRTAYELRDTVRTPDLEGTMAVLARVGGQQADSPGRVARARLDVTATGPVLGRAVVLTTRPATVEDLPEEGRETPLALSIAGGGRGSGPGVPGGVLRRAAVRRVAVRPGAVRRGAGRRWRQLVAPEEMLTAVPGLPGSGVRGAVPPGCVRYEFVVPDAGAWLVGQILRMLQGMGSPPVRAELYRCGPGNQSPLSFAKPGWALALDLPAGSVQLEAALSRANLLLGLYGGRVRLNGACRLSDAALAPMYPQLAHWKSVRELMDPAGRMSSPLGRSLGLVP